MGRNAGVAPSFISIIIIILLLLLIVLVIVILILIVLVLLIGIFPVGSWKGLNEEHLIWMGAARNW